MGFIDGNQVPIVKTGQGVTRKVLGYSDEVMMCEIAFDKGAEGEEHAHFHTQITYVESGEFLFTVNQVSRRVAKGDCVFIPSNAVHSVVCLKEGKLVDVFAPMRKEFVE